MIKGYATLKDVAEEAGTTAATVSYVLSNKQGRYISEEMRTRVLKAVDELGYIKSIGASHLKGKERRLVGLLVPQFENQFFTRIITASENELVAAGFDLMICDTLDSPEREKDILCRMMEQRVDGVILAPTQMGMENTEILRRVGMKMVIVDRPLMGFLEYNWVTTDNYNCGEVAAQYLHSKGHKKIAFVGWSSGIDDLDSRGRAVVETMEKYSQDKVILVNGGFSREEGYRLTEVILDEHPEVTSIVYGFNIQAAGGVCCLRDRKIAIPEDMSVVITGSPDWVNTGNNNFTYIDQNEKELGRKAANLLIKTMRGIVDQFEHVIQDCSIVEGDSVIDMN